VALAIGIPIVGVGVALGGSNAPTSTDIPDLGVPRAEAATVIDSYADAADGVQAEALADGAVTLTEYRAAANASVSCLQRGLDQEATRRDVPVSAEVSDPTLSTDRFTYTYTTSIRAEDGVDLADLPRSLMSVPDQVEERCRARHLDLTEQAYHVQQLADPGFIDDVATDFRSCSAESGVRIAADESVHAALDEAVRGLDGATPPDAFIACLNDYPSMTEVAPGPVR
jgi:hypothetical protein